MIALADTCVVTKTDLISQAEKEVFRESIRRVSKDMDIVETNAVLGTGLKYLYRLMDSAPACEDMDSLELRVKGLGISNLMPYLCVRFITVP